MATQVIRFLSFGRPMNGRIVTQTSGGDFIVFARNPYGTHNLCLVGGDSETAYAHGNMASLLSIDKRAYRKARAFLAARGTGKEWVFAPV